MMLIDLFHSAWPICLIPSQYHHICSFYSPILPCFPTCTDSACIEYVCQPYNLMTIFEDPQTNHCLLCLGHHHVDRTVAVVLFLRNWLQVVCSFNESSYMRTVYYEVITCHRLCFDLFIIALICLEFSVFAFVLHRGVQRSNDARGNCPLTKLLSCIEECKIYKYIKYIKASVDKK